MTAGYSGTPLSRKLGFKENFKIQLFYPPEYYLKLFTDLPKGVVFVKNARAKKDLIHYFVQDLERLKNDFPLIKSQIIVNGSIWISWRKKTSKIVSNISGNDIRDLGLGYGLVDVKVCAIDEVWSGLKFVIPVSKR